jgi:hypothetical protein
MSPVRMRLGKTSRKGRASEPVRFSAELLWTIGEGARRLEARAHKFRASMGEKPLRARRFLPRVRRQSESLRK